MGKSQCYPSAIFFLCEKQHSKAFFLCFFLCASVTCSGISCGSLYLHSCLLYSPALLSACNQSVPNTNLEFAFKEFFVSKLQLSDAMAELVDLEIHQKNS